MASAGAMLAGKGPARPQQNLSHGRSLQKASPTPTVEDLTIDVEGKTVHAQRVYVACIHVCAYMLEQLERMAY